MNNQRYERYYHCSEHNSFFWDWCEALENLGCKLLGLYGSNFCEGYRLYCVVANNSGNRSTIKIDSRNKELKVCAAKIPSFRAMSLYNYVRQWVVRQLEGKDV
ncbi:hypothetical protein KS4_23200 [Poriferisphaera corsica]|uniref:Uncharacterized protein n=1 Tax=Poriferisphaera corsica TaxID=2528020 RepID=A0A517YVJ8_9BACT|nr:hypothetical protein KS4_23200 [Poriferisphaera corsica]